MAKATRYDALVDRRAVLNMDEAMRIVDRTTTSLANWQGPGIFPASADHPNIGSAPAAKRGWHRLVFDRHG